MVPRTFPSFPRASLKWLLGSGSRQGPSGAFLALPFPHSICVSSSPLSLISTLGPALWQLPCPFLMWLAGCVCARVHGVSFVCLLRVAVCTCKGECASVYSRFLTKELTRAL